MAISSSGGAASEAGFLSELTRIDGEGRLSARGGANNVARSLLEIHAVTIHGKGPATMVLAHGIGGHQGHWDGVLDALGSDVTAATFDVAGFGRYDPALFDAEAHASLFGYADDLTAICGALGLRDVVYVGHSLSGMAGILASVADPGLFSRLVLVGASACYRVDPATGYEGGMTADEIEGILAAIRGDYHLWASGFAGYVMGNPDRPELTSDFARSLAACPPDIAESAMRASLAADYRAFVNRVSVPTLVLNATDDPAVPDSAAKWLAEAIPGAVFSRLSSRGHFPHVVDPGEVADQIKAFCRAGG